MEQEILQQISQLRSQYHDNIDKMTIAQEADLSSAIKKACSQLQDFYLKGVKIPGNVNGNVLGMRKNEHTIEIGCQVMVTIGKKVTPVFIKSQGVTQELAAASWNADDFINKAGLKLVWKGDDIVCQ